MDPGLRSLNPTHLGCSVGFRVEGLGFRVRVGVGFGFRVLDLHRVWGIGLGGCTTRLWPTNTSLMAIWILLGLK